MQIVVCSAPPFPEKDIAFPANLQNSVAVSMDVPNAEKQTKILVTGGTGLVGSALQWAIRSVSGPFGKEHNEEWVFLSSADADLR